MTIKPAWRITMKLINGLIISLLLFVGTGRVLVVPALAADSPAEPAITLSVKNEPLGEVLDAITAETGYQFKLNSQWQEWPVSATIGNLPLEKGLKRLLRSLNHTIIWEADRTITIMVYGKAEAGPSAGGAVSFAAPPQAEQAMPEPPVVSEGNVAEETPAEVAAEETGNKTSAETEVVPDQTTDEIPPTRAGRPVQVRPPVRPQPLSPGEAAKE